MKSSSLGLAAALILISACDDKQTQSKPGDPTNAAPVAVTNGDQTVSEGATVTLDGARSYDADNDIQTWTWTQSTGPTVALDAASSPVATFSAPDVNNTAVLRFTLTIMDTAGLFSEATVVITVIDLNAAPVVNAGDDQDVLALAAVTLSGSAIDDGTVAAYAWRQVSGPDAGDITNADQSTATVTAPDVDQLRTMLFELAVTDNEGKVGTDIVAVRVAPVASSIAFVPPLPASPQRNAVWGEVVVGIVNAAGNRIVGGAPSRMQITLTAALQDGTNVTTNLGGTLTLTATSGRAHFRDLSYPLATAQDNGIELTATAAGLDAATSDPIEVVWPSTLPGGLVSTGAIVPLATVLVGNDFLLAGTFTGTVDFDYAGGASAESLRTATNQDVFLARYAAAGSLTWVQTIQSPGDLELAALASAGGNLFLAVGTSDTVTFPHDTTPVEVSASGGADVAFAKVSGDDGATQWAGAIVGTGDEVAYAIALESAGNVVIGGAFEGTDTDFDPDDAGTALSSSIGANNTTDGFVLELDSAGNYLWHMPLPQSDQDDAVHALGFQFTSRDVLAAGRSDSDAFVVRLAADDGEEKTSAYARIGGASAADVVDIQYLEEGNQDTMMLAGQFDGTIDFDPDDTDTFELTANGPELFIARLNMAGAFSWAHRVGATGSIAGLAVGTSVTLAGTVSGDVDFAPDDGGAVVSAGAFDTPYVASFSTGSGEYRSSMVWPGNDVDLPLTAFTRTGSRMLLSGILTTAGTVDLDPNPTVVNFTLATGEAAWVTKLDEAFSVVP